MRNLYSQLGISTKATAAEIRDAIPGCLDNDVCADAEEVLLRPKRRRVYDDVNHVLCDIAALRLQLGLRNGDNWDYRLATEYAPTNKLRSQFQLYQKKRKRWIRAHQKFGTLRAILAVPLGVARAAFGVLRQVALRLGFVWLLIAAAWAFSFFDKSPSTASSSTHPPKTHSVFNKPIIPMPASGTVRNVTPRPPAAPFQIEVRGNANYLLKLADRTTGNTEVDIFVRAGQTVQVEVPLGVYELRYAAGTTWYGYQYRFGPETAYSKADSLFRFHLQGDGVTGYTVTLFPVPNGNLSTHTIAPSQF